jgi:hypothetical protein
VLAHVLSGSLQGSRDINTVIDNRFDAVSSTFYLGSYSGHLVPVKGVISVSIDVVLSHDCSGFGLGFSSDDYIVIGEALQILEDPQASN